MRRLMTLAFLVGSAATAEAVEGWVVFTRVGGGGGLFREADDLYVMQLGSSPTKIEDGGVFYACFSPDGQKVCYSRRNGSSSELVVANRNGSGKQVIAAGFSTTFGDSPWPSWRAADTIVWTTGVTKTVTAYDVGSGSTTTLYTSNQTVKGATVNTALTRLCFFNSSTRVNTAVIATGPSSEQSYSGCGYNLSPDGSKFTNNQDTHNACKVRNFSGTTYKTVSPSTGYFNRQRWSVNHTDWITYPQGPSYQLTEWSQVYIHNIETNERIRVTNQTSYNDVAQDFWVGSSGPSAPVVTTSDATNVGTTTARLGGNVTSTGGENPTVSILWGDNDAGTGTWDHVENMGTRSTGSFQKDVSGLTPDTTYYVRCRATNSAGSSWGAVKSLTTTQPQDIPAVVRFTAPAAGASVSGTVAVNATAHDPDAGTADGSGIASVAFSLRQGTLTVASHLENAAPYDWLLDTTTLANGSYTLRAVATSTTAAGSGSSSAERIVSVANTTSTHLRVNCGDNAYDVAGWERDDAYVIDGGDYVFDADADVTGVTNAAPVTVYRSCRRDAHSYSFPVPDGVYTLRIHFFDAHDSALRAADYTTEGALILDDFNICAEAGNGKALAMDFVVTVADGNGLQLVCDRDAGNDVFESGVEVIPGAVVNAPPVAVDDAATTGEVTPVTVDVLANDADADGDQLTVTDVTQPSGGTVVANPDGSITYTPASGTTGDDAFTYTVSDVHGDLDVGTVTVNVLASGQDSISIESPSAGAVWYVGTTPAISWSAVNVDTVVILYRTSDTTYWELISPSVGVADARWGAYAWTVPDAPSTQCQIHVEGYFGEAPCDSDVFEIRSVVDTDGDGMDDDWEVAHFGDLSNDGTGDSDGDGTTDYEEFQGGTDPAVPADAGTESGNAFSCAALRARAKGARALPQAVGLVFTTLLLALGLRRRTCRAVARTRR